MITSASFLQRLNTEPLTDYRPIPFWSWNDKLELPRLFQQIQDLKDIGAGGFFMHARPGLETEYCSEEWYDITLKCAEEGVRQGLNGWCYDENGWPSGFAGGALLKNPENWIHYLRFAVTEAFDPAAMAVYTLHDGKLSRVTAPVEGETAYQCVYDCTNDSQVDVLNPRVVDEFIRLTHQQYYDRYPAAFGTAIQGFFTDEPQYMRSQTGYSPMMLTEFPNTYGQDLLDQLGALFVDCDGCKQFRFRYWRLMNTLYADHFAGRLYRWCEEHNCRLTGHTVEERSLMGQMECCAGVMPFYEHEHIPGMDCLARNELQNEIMPRQVSSVAQQLGKPQVIVETFGCCGWDVTPKELKHLCDWMYVNGVNLMCHHLYPYSIRGQRKRDFPAFYSLHNPWTKELGKFNEYFTNLGFLLAQTREEAPVLVIHALHSAYLTFDRRDMSGSVGKLDAAFDALVEQLAAAGIGHHYADERLLEKYGSVSGDALQLGQCRYSCVVIPDMENLDSSTAALLKQYAANGGKLYLAGQTPSLADGAPADLSFLRPNITMEQMIAAYSHYDRYDTAIRSTLRTGADGNFLYAVNTSMEQTQQLKLHLPFGGAVRFDPMTKAVTPVLFEACADGICLPLNLAPGESIVLMQEDAAASAPALPPVQTVLPLEPVMQLPDVYENTLTLDTAELSYDGAVYSEPLPVMGISDLLLRRQKNSTVFLRYRFRAEEIPADLTLEVETLKNTVLTVNGTQVVLGQPGKLDFTYVRDRIARLVHPGENEIVLKLAYHQSDHVYRVFNGFYYGHGEITEALINCLSYETNIEAVYLSGHFGVRSETPYCHGDNQTRITDGGFVLTAPARQVDVRDITVQNFPFFHDAMTVETEVDLPDGDWKLRCSGRLEYVKAYVNDQYAGLFLFNDVLDLGSFLHAGKNRIRLELMASCRNLYGPHHLAGCPEPMGVGPDTFQLFGSWDQGHSSRYADSYAFVRFGLDQCQLEK